jgi:hypothetical protein
MNAVNYTLATQIEGGKFNAHRVSKVLQDLGPDERALANSIIKDAYAIGNKIKSNIPEGSAPVQRASGGRINRDEGGRTPFPWQQFYAPKGDAIGPVAPKRLIQPGKDEEGNLRASGRTSRQTETCAACTAQPACCALHHRVLLQCVQTGLQHGSGHGAAQTLG